MKLIDKAAVVAEIERKKDEITFLNEFANGTKFGLKAAIDIVNSLEVKEPQVKELAKVQHIKEMCKENGDSLTQEPVSEELMTSKSIWKESKV